MAAIHEANDKELRDLIHKHEFVIVKFIDEQCAICKLLAPKFENMADEAAYKDVLFLKIDAKENPVSSKEVRLSGTPFLATFRSGKLVDCGLVKDETEIKEMLDKML